MTASGHTSDPELPAGEAAGALTCRTIAVTGAGGALGRKLVPWLAARGAHVVAVGRDTRRLATLDGTAETCAAHDFPDRLAQRDIDAIVDLAVLNSDAVAPAEAFRAVNVDRLAQLARQARECGVRRIVALSSFHAADPDNRSAYARSKRELEQWAAAKEAGTVRVVVLPKVTHASGGPSGLLWKGLAMARPAAPFGAVASAIERAMMETEPAGSPVWVASMGHHGLYGFITRIVDIVFAMAVLILLGWLMIALVVFIRRDSPGPAIFRQERVGRDERAFTLYKFRTMAVGTRQAGTHEVSAASVTRIGSFLRRTKLDELPQAWNILRGELALVGPRPCLPVQHALVAERRAHGIFRMRPGLTGLAQVNGIDMSDPAELVRWEVLYMRIRGLLLDLRIVWQTFVGRGGGDRTSA